MWFSIVGIISIALSCLYFFWPQETKKLDKVGQRFLLGPDEMLEKRIIVALFYFIAGIALIYVAVWWYTEFAWLELNLEKGVRFMWFAVIGVIAIIMSFLYFFRPNALKKIDAIGKKMLFGSESLLKRRILVGFFYLVVGIGLICVKIFLY